VAYNDGAPQLVPEFVFKYGVNFPTGFAPRPSVMDYLQHPPGRPGYVPELIFIDRNRVIRGQYSGEQDFFKDQDKNVRALVESLVKEPVASKKANHSAHKKRT
jgi:hypothetical protein